MARFIQIFVLLIVLLTRYTTPESISDYMKRRKTFFENEHMKFLGSNLNLTTDEMKVNQELMKLKVSEFNTSATNGFYPSMHFFRSKPLIEKSSVFWFIRKMPKGSALHLHDTSMVDAWWLVKQATYRHIDKLYMCYDAKRQLNFIYSNTKPVANFRGWRLAGCDWELVNDVRNRYGADIFDEWLHGNLTLNVPDPEAAYPTQDIVWARFYSLFGAADGLIFFSEIFKSYFTEAISEFYVDNVQYFEFRALLSQVYELDGTKHYESWLMDAYVNISTEFSQSYPDFVGAKVIYSTSRARDKSDIKDSIAKTLELRKKYPDHMVGYDLVGQEDPGRALIEDIDVLLLPSQQGHDLPYYFHAGETNWVGRQVDENLIDALLLNTTRIGHGYAITKHPYVMEVSRQKGIAVEVCPISNQVLKLVDDLRNHPATELIATDYPLVISSDDPGLWGAQGLSFDFYEAFMGLGGAKADLKFLKQLALNSIQYSSLNKSGKQHLFSVWQRKWTDFIQEMKGQFRL